MSAATAGLTAGTCNGTITINATNPATGAAAVNSPITIPVTLFVSTTAQLVLTPAQPAAFTSDVGTQFPPPQNITLTSTNTDVLNYTVAFQSNNGNWLFAGPQSGIDRRQQRPHSLGDSYRARGRHLHRHGDRHRHRTRRRRRRR